MRLLVSVRSHEAEVSPIVRVRRGILTLSKHTATTIEFAVELNLAVQRALRG